MAIPGLYEALLGSYGDDNFYRSQDPFFGAGRSVSSWQLPQAQSGSEAIFGPLFQGILQGALTGYGISNARETAYDDYRNSPLFEALSPGVAAFDYTGEDAPEGWSAKLGKQDLLSALLAKDQILQEEQAKKDTQSKIFDTMFKKMVDLGAIPGLADAESEQIKRKKLADMQADADAYGYNPKKEEEVDKLRKEFSALPEVKNFSQVQKGSAILNKAIADPSSVSDQELVRYAILMIEPGMAVREGEQAAVANSASIPEQWKGILSKSLSGGAQLGEDVRKGIKDLAIRAYEGNKGSYDKTLSFFQEQAKLKNIDPNRISYLGESPSIQQQFTDYGPLLERVLPSGEKVRVRRRLSDGKYEEVQ